MIHPQFEPFPELFTPRLRLRRMIPEDDTALFEMRSDPVVMQYVERPLATSLEEVQQLILRIDTLMQTNEAINWTLSFHDDPRMIGNIVLWNLNLENRRAELGYLLQQRFHRQGYMSEALPAVLNFGFQIMKLHSITAFVNPLNKGSIKILLQNRFIKEGHLRECIYFNNQYADSLIFSVIDREYTSWQKGSSSL